MRSAYLPPAFRKLVNELSKLPSIGEKSALRLAQHLLSAGVENSQALELAINEARNTVRFCESCFGYSEAEICNICENSNRSEETLCVVEKPIDIIAVEQIGGFDGKYHVLHGLWSPMRGVTPEKIKLAALLARVERSYAGERTCVRELVLATGTTVEGDATAYYIANNLAHLNIKVTRIAQGLPQGGELEYADESTLRYALEGRKVIEIED